MRFVRRPPLAFGRGKIAAGARIDRAIRQFVQALLDETRESTDGEMIPLEGRVSFERVSFSYDGQQQVLREVSFAVHPGQMLALVGHTGSGKSTIISLLMGFYPLDQGCIRFDDHPMSALSLSAVRRSMGHKGGSGGSAGLAWLEKSLQREAFPELWSARTRI